jgi:branched-chain amino acid transport system permease protein
MSIDRPCGTYDSSYDQDMAIVRTRLQWILLVGGLILLLTLPLYSGNYMLYMVNNICITLIAVVGLMILMGYCGLVSLGQSAFMGVGAYTAGMLAHHLGCSFWLALPCSALMAGIIGVLFGLPSLRIKGFYLSMATLAAQFIIMTLILNADPALTGGATSLSVPAPSIGDFVFNSQSKMFYLIVPLTLLMIFFAKNIVRTGTGRAFIAIRDNDLAAEVMGINVFSYKLLAFFIGNVFAGVAGCLWAYTMRSIDPEQFTLLDSVWLMGMVFIGGQGSIAGAVFGTIFIRGLDELVKTITPSLPTLIPQLKIENVIGFGPVIFAVVVIVFLIYEPRGLAHRWEVFKTSYRMNPFTY